MQASPAANFGAKMGHPALRRHVTVEVLHAIFQTQVIVTALKQLKCYSSMVLPTIDRRNSAVTSTAQ